MLSLKEEIGSFRAQIQRLNLAGYTSLFESGRGGEPSLKEVVGENGFLVESLKMMGSVFLNHCWLNERVYAKIMQHELSLHDSQTRLNALAHAVERKLDDSLRAAKALHEDSAAQNRRSKEVVEGGLRAISEEMQDRVTDAQLNLKIREILRQYDQGALDDTPQLTEPVFVPVRMLSSAGERRTGKVGYEEHYRLREEVEEALRRIRKQLQESEHEGAQNKERLGHCARLLDLQEAELKRQAAELSKLHNEHRYSSKQQIEEMESLSRRLDDRTDEEEWKRRLGIFEIRTVDPLRAQLQDSLQQLRVDAKRGREESYLKVSLLESQLQRLAEELTEFRASVGKEVQDVAVLELKFTEMETRVTQENSEARGRVEEWLAEGRRTGKELEKSVRREVGELRGAVQKLSSSVEEKAFKAIAKKIESSFLSFETDLMESRELIKTLSASLALANDQITALKDLLSQKANFTDVVHYVEGKADKRDFREIRSRLEDAPTPGSQSHPLLVRQHSETVAARNNTSRHERSLVESPNPRAVRTPRTEFVGPGSQREKTRTRVDLEGTARRLLVRESKKRVMQSYGSLIGDLRR